MRPGIVYLVKNLETGDHKIGRSRYLRTRLAGLGRQFSISLVWYIGTNDCIRLEAFFHKTWIDKRVFGEWFSLTEEDVAAFRSLMTVQYKGRERVENCRTHFFDPGTCPKAALGPPRSIIVEIGKVVGAMK